MADLLERGEADGGRGPDENWAFTPAPRAPQVFPVGEHTLPTAQQVRERLVAGDGHIEVDLVGTRVWLDSRNAQVALHVGDTSLGDT